MKHLKQYEDTSIKPKVGDYVLCEEDGDEASDMLNLFIKNNIGVVDTVDINSKYPYVISYENVPKNINDEFKHNYNRQCLRQMKKHEVKYWANNKEELEIKISANKYNL